MKKQKKQLLIMLIALVLLGGGYFGLRYYNEVRQEKELEALNDEIVLVDLEEEDIIRLSYNYKEKDYTFEKKDDTWYYTEQPDWKMNQYRLSAIASRMADLAAISVIENVTDMSLYGLDQLERYFTFETADESYTFYAGEYNSLTSTYYICREGENTVYVVYPLTVTGYNMTPEEIIEEEEDTAETSTVTVS